MSIVSLSIDRHGSYAENSGDNSLQNSFGRQSLHICTQTHLPSFFALINKASCVS